MSAQHTPGPWAVALAGSRSVDVTTDYADPAANLINGWPKRIARLGTNRWRSAAQRRADALLIAAAPDLLAALIEASRSGAIDRAALRAARAAIDKATGSTS